MFSFGDAAGGGIARELDPRAKAIAYLCLSALVLLTTQAGMALVVCVAFVAAVASLGLARVWLGMGRVLLPTLVLLGVVVDWAAGPAPALTAILRLLALLAAGVLFFATTPPEDLGEALLVSGLSPQTAFLFEGTMRFVPTMGQLLREVRDAQASRGIRFDGIYLLKNGPALLAPLLVSALRFADTLAEALEARGFGSPVRTPLRDYRFTSKDWLLVAGAGGLWAAGVVWILVA